MISLMVFVDVKHHVYLFTYLLAPTGDRTHDLSITSPATVTINFLSLDGLLRKPCYAVRDDMFQRCSIAAFHSV